MSTPDTVADLRELLALTTRLDRVQMERLVGFARGLVNLTDVDVFWKRAPGWIRYRCPCGYTFDTIDAGPLADARPCGLCGTTVTGERHQLGD